MFRKVLTGWLIAACMAGCAAQVGDASPKADLDIDTDDALIAAAEGRADSASRPTLVGEIESGSTYDGRFSRSGRYLAYSFAAQQGQAITLTTAAITPASLDTVLILYKATSTGRPSGASLAFNDDISSLDSNSRLAFVAEETREYVAVVRRFDRGSSGTFTLSLQLTAHPVERLCGGPGSSDCGAGAFCDYTADDTGTTCGANNAQGTCRTQPDVCAEILAPVCGCDNRTYDNACSAASAGVSVKSEGECGPSRVCPPTGIPCTPECPGSGRINGRACRRGHFDARTCTCEAISDCRTTGCREGATCQRCWTSNACLPDGAVC